MKLYVTVCVPTNGYRYLRIAAPLEAEDASDDQVVSPGTVETDSTAGDLERQRNEHHGGVKLDPFHYFARFTDLLSRSHGSYLEFCHQLTDAVLVCDQGDIEKVLTRHSIW